MGTINLIGDTGIQFIDLTAKLGEGSPALKMTLDYCEVVHSDQSLELLFANMNERGEYVDAIERTPIVDPKTREPIRRVETVSAKRAIECFEGQWIPLPYFRQRNVNGKTGFEKGPLTWARGCFQPLRVRGPGDATHSFVLAFDTVVAEGAGTSYLSPLQHDVSEGTEFRLAHEPEHIMGFLAEGWVQQWLLTCFEARRARLGYIGGGDQRFPHLAFFAALMRLLAEAVEFPTVHLLTGGQEIEVDLILDIGNSRSCGLLLQSSPNEPIAFNTNSSKLALRDLSQPDLVYDEPFEMHVEFVRAGFGPADATAMCGRNDAFAWPSIVRIGDEAVRRSVVNGSDTYETGMSSPKRYLWDERKRDEAWVFNETTEDVPKPALTSYTLQFSSDGKLLENEGDRMLAFRSEYSRASLMTFVFAELLSHARCQINSVGFREHHGAELRRRVLSRVIVTCPTAMLEREKRALRAHAETAVKSLDLFYGRSVGGGSSIRVIPSSEDLGRPLTHRNDWGYDEATCVQLAYVYGEVASRFGGNAEAFFELFGRPRVVADDGPSRSQTTLRIASIDIGGGTTDVMVCNHLYDARSATPMVKPIPEFWEGFNLAGDDIVKRVVERCVLPAIAQAACERGCGDKAMVLNTLFAGNFGAQSASDRNYRRLFANQVAVPLALNMLRHAVDRAPLEDRTYRAFFEDHPSPQRVVEEHVEKKIEALGGTGFRLADMTFRLDYREVELAVRQVMQKRIGELCGILAQLDCDLLLLAGRPALMPVVREMIVSFLPVPPDRIINLGRFRSGTWYPFADARGLIRDPKTCVTVGAAVALMGGTLGRLSGFRLDTAALRGGIHSTAEFVGVYDAATATLGKVAFSDEDGGQGEVMFSGEMLLGMRQMPADSWIAAPMFKLRFATAEDAEALKNKLPLTIGLRRNPAHMHLREDIHIHSIHDRDGQPVRLDSVVALPQTLPSESGYWLDSGSFLVSLY